MTRTIPAITENSEPLPRIERLRDDIDSAYVWTMLVIGTTISYRPQTMRSMAGYSNAVAYTYNEEELAEIDPRLPAALLAMPLINNRIPGKHVVAALRLWNNELTKLDTAMFHELPENYYVSPELATIEKFAVDGGVSLRLKCTGFKVGTTAAGVSFVLGSGTPQLTLNNWLDDHHPSWRDQVLLAETLSLSGIELAGMLLFSATGHQPSTSVDLSMDLHG